MMEARELLEGMRRAAIDIRVLRERRDELEERTARTRSAPLRDPEMRVQTSRDISDRMGEAAATLVDMEKDIQRLTEIVEADRQRAAKIFAHFPDSHVGRDLKQLAMLYFVEPITMQQHGRITEWHPRSWSEVGEVMHLSHTGIMRRRRRLFTETEKIIQERGL